MCSSDKALLRITYSIVFCCVLFIGEPNLMDAIVAWVNRQ